MASPIITPFSTKVETEYRPVSRMAIVGLLLSCFSPFLFAVDNGVLWFFFFVIPGGVVSILARRTILRSEGSLAGEPLAILGIVLAVACGLGWATSRLVSVYVTDMEARQAVDRWIAQMQRGEAGGAFLMTLLPNGRNIDFNPEDHRRLRQRFPAQAGAESEFDSFLVNPVYGPILRYGDRAHLTYVSLLESTISRGTSFFRLKYKLETPISTGDVIIVARSEDTTTPQGVLRQWYMYRENTNDPTHPTSYGEQLEQITTRSTNQITSFVAAVASADLNQANKLIDPATQSSVEYKQLISYLHPAQESVRLGLKTPLRIRKDEKTAQGWKLNLECTAVVMDDREVNFSLMAVTDSSQGAKWTLSDFKFLGTHKLVPQIPTMSGGKGMKAE